MSQSSAVHVLVKASGKNATSTRFLPRNDDNETRDPAVESAVKSGAASPTAGLLRVAVAGAGADIGAIPPLVECAQARSSRTDGQRERPYGASRRGGSRCASRRGSALAGAAGGRMSS